MTIPDDLLDFLMKDYKNPEDLIAYSGVIRPPIPLQTGPPVPEQSGPVIPV